MNGFGWAIRRMEDGGKVTRAGWNGKNMWLAIMKPGIGSDMTLPYIFMCTGTGDSVPWLASQTDMLATDWGEVI